MLGNVQSNIAGARSPRVQWGPGEWDKIAAQLHVKHPTRRYKTYSNPPFTLDDVEEAAEAALPQESLRLIEDFSEVRSYLFEACGRFYSNKNLPVIDVHSTSASDDDKIRWSPEEWEKVVRELYAICPEVVEAQFHGLSMIQIRQAMLTLPLDRHRRFKQLVGLRNQLAKMWFDHGARIKADIKNSRAVVEFPNGLIVQPVPKKSDEHSAVASALQEAFKAPPKEVKPVVQVKAGAMKYAVKERVVKTKRIDWTSEEWMAIAREMVRQDPYGTLLTSQVPHIATEALRAAQRNVIEPHRRRTLPNANGAAHKLGPKFKEIFEELEVKMLANVVEEKQPEATTEVVQALAYVEQPLPIPTVEEAPVIEVAAPVVVEASPEPAPVVQAVIAAVSGEVSTTLASAAAPLVNFLLSKLANAMIPELTKTLIPEISKSLLPEIAQAVSQIQPQKAQELPDFAGMMRDIKAELKSEIAAQISNIKIPAPVIDYGQFVPQATTRMISDVIPVPDYQPSPVAKLSAPAGIVQPAPATIFQQPVKEKPQLPKVVIIGPMGAQQGEMSLYYKDKVDVEFIEHGKGIKEAASTCDVFFVSTRVPSTITKQVKANTSREKIQYFNGGLSSLKRDIDMWLLTHKG